MISKSLSTSEKWAALHEVVPALAEFAQSIYPLMVSHSDDFGRQQGDLTTVRYLVNPSSPRSFPEWRAALTALHEVGLISWYEVDGKPFIQIEKFDPHQVGLHKRTASHIPGDSGKFPEFPHQRTERRELKEGKEGTSTAPDGAVASPPVENPRTPQENLEVITTLVGKEILPTLGLSVSTDDLIEATKERCAKLHVAYNSEAVRKAVESALFRARLKPGDES
jgi:hypothetical protein